MTWSIGYESEQYGLETCHLNQMIVIVTFFFLLANLGFINSLWSEVRDIQQIRRYYSSYYCHPPIVGT